MDNTNMENMLAAALGGGLSDNIDDVLAAGLNADDDDISVRQSTEVRPIAATEADEVDEGKYDVKSDGDGLSARHGEDYDSPRYEDGTIETEETPVIEKVEGSEYEVREPKEVQNEDSDEVLREDAEEENSPSAIDTDESNQRNPEAELGDIVTEENSPRNPEAESEGVVTEENSPRNPEAESREDEEVDEESPRPIDTEENSPRGDGA